MKFRKIAKKLLQKGHFDLAKEVLAAGSIYLKISDIKDQKEQKFAEKMYDSGKKYVLFDPKPIYEKKADDFEKFPREELLNVQQLIKDTKPKAVNLEDLEDRIKYTKPGDTINTYTDPNFKVKKLGHDERIEWEDTRGKIKGKGHIMDFVKSLQETGVRVVSAVEKNTETLVDSIIFSYITHASNLTEMDRTGIPRGSYLLMVNDQFPDGPGNPFFREMPEKDGNLYRVYVQMTPTEASFFLRYISGSEMYEYHPDGKAVKSQVPAKIDANLFTALAKEFVQNLVFIAVQAIPPKFIKSRIRCPKAG